MMQRYNWPALNKLAVAGKLTRSFQGPAQKLMEENSMRVRPYKLSHLRPTARFVVPRRRFTEPQRVSIELMVSRLKRTAMKARAARRRTVLARKRQEKKHGREAAGEVQGARTRES